MKMIPSNGFSYNFNGPLNTFGQLSIPHHGISSLNSTMDFTDTSDTIPSSLQLLDESNNYNNQSVYEFHSNVNSSNNHNTAFTNMENNSDEIPVISLFKLKSFLNQPKLQTKTTNNSLQNMFNNDNQNINSIFLSLDGNYESNNNSPLNNTNSTTSSSFYSNLAPSAIGASAIVTTPMLLSQQTEQLATTTSQSSCQPSSSHQISSLDSIHNLNRNELVSSSINIKQSTSNVSPINSSRAVTSRKFVCKYCNETFQSKGEMQIHYSGHHREPKPFKCPYEKCTKRFQKTNYLKQHLRIHTNETPFHCTLCDRKFKQQSHRNQHIRTHTGAKPYKCKYADCDKSFSQESNLRSHMRSHESGRPFKCNSCHLTFDDEQSLLQHIPRHRETKHTKTFICDYCGKSYSQELYLSKHVQQKHADRVLDVKQNSLLTSSSPNATNEKPVKINQQYQENNFSITNSSLNKKISTKLKQNTSFTASSNTASSNQQLRNDSSSRIQTYTQAPIQPIVSNEHSPNVSAIATSVTNSTAVSWLNSNKMTSTLESINCLNNNSNHSNSNNNNNSNNNQESINLSEDPQITGHKYMQSTLTSSPNNISLNSNELNHSSYSIQATPIHSSDFHLYPNSQHQSTFTALVNRQQRTSDSQHLLNSQSTAKYFSHENFMFPSMVKQYTSTSQQPQHSNDQLQLHTQHHLYTQQQQQQQQQQQLLQQNHLQNLHQVHLNEESSNPQQLHLNHAQTSSPQNQQPTTHPQSSQASQAQSTHQHLQHQQQHHLLQPIQSQISQHQSQLNQQLLTHQQQQQQSQHHQLIALNQIRNYACMPNNTNIPQNNSSSVVNNIFLNSSNSGSVLQSNASSACSEFPVLIV